MDLENILQRINIYSVMPSFRNEASMSNVRFDASDTRIWKARSRTTFGEKKDKLT